MRAERAHALRRTAAESGLTVAAIALEPLDLTALEPAAQAACTDSMGRLLCALEVPLQFVVRRRRAPPPGPSGVDRADRVAAELDAAMRGHQAQMLASLPAFRSEVTAVIRRADGDQGALQRQLGMVIEMLRGIGVRCQVVPGDALGEPADLDPAGWVERARAVGVAGGTRCGLELERLPGRSVGLGWLHTVLAAAAEFDAAIHLIPVDATVAHRAVERRLRSLTADRLLELDRGRIGDAAVDVGLEAAEALRDRLARNEVRPVRLSIVVAAHGRDQPAARHAAEVIRAAAAAGGLRLRHSHLRHAAALRSTHPLGEPVDAGKLVDSAAAATCLPLTETLCDDPGGYRLGVGRRSGVPVVVDVFDSSKHSNANTAVFATSGHGKSFTLGALVLEAAAHGVGSLIVDPEGEYQRLMHASGGQYLRLGRRAAGALNVFDAAPTAEEAIPVAVDLINVLCGSVLGEVERARVDAALHEAVISAAAAGRMPLLGDCVAALEHKAPRAATVLRRVCGGTLGSIFNAPSDIDLEGELCAISLRDLPHEFVPAATLLIAQWLWTRVRREPRRRHIVLDEVGALCVHPPLRDLLVQLARRCRKYGASLVVATQNVEDLLRSEEGSVVATNCATVLLGGHRAAEAAHMERAFGLTVAQRRFVEHAPRGEFLLLAGRRRCEIRVDVPDLHRAILVAQ